MSLYDKPVECGECRAQFIVDDSCIGSIKAGDLEVQYLSCPSCTAKHLIFVSDARMRELVQKRKTVQAKIRAARVKKFKKRTFKKYLREYEQIKKEQNVLFLELKAQGEKILRGESKEET